MCEIAVIDPEQSTIEMTHQLASIFNEEQGDGLGVLAIRDCGEKFEYRTYKSTDPHWSTLLSFLRRNWDDTYRFVVHGRAATAGKVNRQNSHPIETDCDLCDFNYVVHNGSVRNHRNIRPQLTSNGHELNTPVDSEIIAHKVSELPDTVEDHDRRTYSFRGNLNYLLFSEDGIFVRVSDKYALADDFTMTCRANELDGFDDDTSTEWMLISPGGDIETKERTAKSYTNSAGYRSGGNWRNREEQKWAQSGGRADNDNSGDGEKYTIRYPDLASGITGLVVIKVAPGVLRLINEQENNQTFIRREEHPKVYYHWVKEDAPDNIEEMEAAAERIRGDTEQASVNEYLSDEDTGEAEAAIAEEATEAWQREVARQRDDVTVEDVANISAGIENLMG